jgi:hypothetical protein
MFSFEVLERESNLRHYKQCHLAKHSPRFQPWDNKINRQINRFNGLYYTQETILYYKVYSCFSWMTTCSTTLYTFSI